MLYSVVMITQWRCFFLYISLCFPAKRNVIPYCNVQLVRGLLVNRYRGSLRQWASLQQHSCCLCSIPKALEVHCTFLPEWPHYQWIWDAFWNWTEFIGSTFRNFSLPEFSLSILQLLTISPQQSRNFLCIFNIQIFQGKGEWISSFHWNNIIQKISNPPFFLLPSMLKLLSKIVKQSWEVGRQ